MFQVLPGFRDFYPQSFAIQNHIFNVWKRCAHNFGFSQFDGPILESLELLTEKSGDEIANQLFHFEDQGGRKVALRPEMTPTLARMVGAHANALRKPIKWFSIGEFFRYERPQKGRLRSFYQFNADILGEESPVADAESIALLVSLLQGFGLSLNDFKVRLSDRYLWIHYLESLGLNEEASLSVLTIIDKLERETEEKTLEQLNILLGDQAGAFYKDVQQIVKLRDLNAVQEFFKAKTQDEQMQSRLDAWGQLISCLDAFGIMSCVHIDLSIVRGLAYYTGFVFEAFEATGKGRALAGGGRYDHLIGKLGGPATPAVGFAMGDVTLQDCLQDKGLIPEYIQGPDVYVVTSDEPSKKIGLSIVSELRKSNISAEYSLKNVNFSKQLKQANQLNAGFAIIIGEDELKENVVTVRNLKDRSEEKVPHDQLLEYFRL